MSPVNTVMSSRALSPLLLTRRSTLEVLESLCSTLSPDFLNLTLVAGSIPLLYLELVTRSE
jgi:hypothetical protein